MKISMRIEVEFNPSRRGEIMSQAYADILEENLGEGICITDDPESPQWVKVTVENVRQIWPLDLHASIADLIQTAVAIDRSCANLGVLITGTECTAESEAALQ